MKLITETHAIALVGPQPPNMSNEDYAAITQAKLKEITELKKAVRAQARKEIESWMLEDAKQRNMQMDDGRLVHNLHEIKESWKDGGEPDEDKIITMFEIMYGRYDRDNKWDIKLERKIMAQFRMEYAASADPKRKGGVARLISGIKTEITKVLQGSANETHGVGIYITRLPEHIKKEDRFKKRIKGVEFYVYRKTASGTVVMEQPGAKNNRDNVANATCVVSMTKDTSAFLVERCV
jgi:hypothetical protein